MGCKYDKKIGKAGAKSASGKATTSKAVRKRTKQAPKGRKSY